MAPGLAEILGKPVVIENRAGAGGNIGIGYVARAAADGYTLLCASSVFVVNASLYRNAPYDPYRDFAPVGTLGASPNLICVRADSGITSLHAADRHGEAQPDRVQLRQPGDRHNAASGGRGAEAAHGDPVAAHPFLGAGPAVQAILAGTVEVLVASQGGSVEAARASGQTLALAQTGATRSPDLPQVPTLGELGIADAVSETFNALYAPAGTPAPVVERLAAAVLAVLARPDVRSATARRACRWCRRAPMG